MLRARRYCCLAAAAVPAGLRGFANLDSTPNNSLSLRRGARGPSAIMKTTLRSLMLAGAAAACISVATSAQAVPAPNPAEFSIIETIDGLGHGQYTVTNNSSDWYVIEFYITHDQSATLDLVQPPHPGWTSSDLDEGDPDRFGALPTFGFF